MKESQFLRLEKELGYSFSDSALLLRCVTHVSYGRDRGESHNETLEFLGDAVLDLAVSDLLMRRFPEKSEGDLSRMRASLVNSTTLAEKAEKLNLGKLLRMAKGEERSGGRTKESILAGAFEAILGGIYWDGGYEAARRVVENYFASDVKEKNLGLQDYKTRLQEISQMLFRAPPAYRLVAESGPDHEKRFVTEINVGGKILGRGEGKSKKQAEQEAAKKALEELQHGARIDLDE
ncbi:MAG: ribonuclease III [Deltaproteobacteria bacterium]|nr:MAG: ribonuclease III [Deltaproteobacteria bacterium]